MPVRRLARGRLRGRRPGRRQRRLRPLPQELRRTPRHAGLRRVPGGPREYCQASRGFAEGARGAAYHGVCPAGAEAAFLEGYHDGRTLHDLEQGLRDTQQRIAADDARIRQIEVDLTAKMAAAMAAAATPEERARLVVETTQLAEERARLREEVKDLQAKRATQEKELAQAREEIVARR